MKYYVASSIKTSIFTYVTLFIALSSTGLSGCHPNHSTSSTSIGNIEGGETSFTIGGYSEQTVWLAFIIGVISGAILTYLIFRKRLSK